MKWKQIQKECKELRSAILTNQSGFSRTLGFQYHFEYFRENWNLTHLFLPEHGLFAELQDQVSGSSLSYNYGNLQIINLYGDDEESLVISPKILSEIDLIIIDIRDVGARYYTFLTSAFYILEKVHEFNKTNRDRSISFLVIDSPNPAGRNIEGSPLEKEFESFVGVRTVVHRHGLTASELLQYYKAEFGFQVEILICPVGELFLEKESFWIPPSPNIPTKETCLVYSGQCLLEGTNLSEGRGTTRPFEIFGAPYINIQNKLLLNQLNKYKDDTYYLRPLIFEPTFHKHKQTLCGGFHLIPLKKKFHSLLFTLHFLKTIQDFYPKDFAYLTGPYEFRSDKKAIELLIGDRFLLGYLEGKNSYSEIKDYLQETEKKWAKKIKLIFG
jgi:uncharacterized protein YbbC (DUF1343 family)